MFRRIIPHELSLAGQALLLATLTFALAVVPEGMDSYVLWPAIGLFYIYFARSFSSPARIRANIPVYTTIETLFLMFYFLLFIAPYQSHLLGLSDIRNNQFLPLIYESGSNQAILAATVGFVAFHFGLSWTKRHKDPASASVASSRSEGTYYLGLSYIVLVLLVTFISIYELAGFHGADEGRYTYAITGGALADGIYLLISMLCTIAIARAVATISQDKFVELPILVALAVVAYWSARILINGDRNNFFLIAIAAGGGLFTFVRRTSWMTLLGCVLISLVLYQAIEVVRLSRDRSFSGLLQTILEEKSNKEASNSSSFTITTATLRATFDIVPSRQDYGYGRFKLIGFAGVIPFIRGSLLGGNHSFTTTADILSYYMLGQNAGWSVGSNVITDIYMDFGTLGIPIVMCLAGLFAGAIQRYATREPFSTRAITFYLLVLANFGELSRYSLDFPVRTLAWTFLLFWVYEHIAGPKGNRLIARPRRQRGLNLPSPKSSQETSIRT